MQGTSSEDLPNELAAAPESGQKARGNGGVTLSTGSNDSQEGKGDGVNLVSVSSYYRRQFRWRDWNTILDSLPPVDGQTVLDLGCGVGDLAAELAARGARVIGIDMNEELVQEAQLRQLPNAEFRTGNLRSLADIGVEADGMWSSFAAAFFPDLPAALERWATNLKAGGWIALTEIDDLFGHEPLSFRTKTLLAAYADDAVAAGRYDFYMGRKLRDYLEDSGFAVSKEMTLDDRELSFSGPARPDVIDAWRDRLDGMKLLRDFCGEDFEYVRKEFLSCLTRENHKSAAKVCCCIATKKDAPT